MSLTYHFVQEGRVQHQIGRRMVGTARQQYKSHNQTSKMQVRRKSYHLKKSIVIDFFPTGRQRISGMILPGLETLMIRLLNSTKLKRDTHRCFHSIWVGWRVTVPNWISYSLETMEMKIPDQISPILLLGKSMDFWCRAGLYSRLMFILLNLNRPI